MVTVRDIRSVIQKHFPVQGAEDWDNPGLQLGRLDAKVSRVLLALELSPDVLDEALNSEVDLILTHHPFIFKPLKCLTDETPDGKMLLDLADKHIALMAAHTNLDSAPNAINQKLCDDLALTHRQVFIKHVPFAAYKIVVFVPQTHTDQVAQAMHNAGAGCVGQYTDVSFRAPGTGCFTCGAESRPAIGQPGSVERVPENRLEMVVSARDLAAVTRAMLQTHPYEEPAFDVFKLDSTVHGLTDLYGFGATGTLPEPIKLADFLAHLKQLWNIDALRASGSPDKVIKKIAIMNGAGARYFTRCAPDIDAFITGDCGHHDFDNANRRGLALIDAGHYDTEKFIPAILKKILDDTYGDALEVKLSRAQKRPFRVW